MTDMAFAISQQLRYDCLGCPWKLASVLERKNIELCKKTLNSSSIESDLEEVHHFLVSARGKAALTNHPSYDKIGEMLDMVENELATHFQFLEKHYEIIRINRKGDWTYKNSHDYNRNY